MLFQKLPSHFVKQAIIIAAFTRLYYITGEIYRIGK